MMRIMCIARLLTFVFVFRLLRCLDTQFVDLDLTCPITDSVVDYKVLEERVSALEQEIATQSERITRLEEALKRSRLQSEETSRPSDLGDTASGPLQTNNSSDGLGLLPYGDTGARTLIRKREAFFDHYKFLSVIKTEAEITAVDSITIQTKSCIFAGDALGKIYLSSKQGDILMEQSIGNGVAIAAITVFISRNNRTSLVVSLDNGEVTYYNMHTEKLESPPYLRVEKFAVEYRIRNASEDRPLQDIFISRYRNLRFAAFLCYASGHVDIVRLNGTLLSQTEIPSSVLAAKSDLGHMYFAHKRGIVLHHLEKRIELNCSLTEDIEMKSFVFDVDKKIRAFGINEKNELLYFSLYKDPHICTIRHRQSVNLPLEKKVILTSVKGYLILTSSAGIGVYNVTFALKSGPREVVLQAFSFIGKSFGFKIDEVQNPIVVAECMKGGILSMHLGNGVLATFESKLPVYEPQTYDYAWIIRTTFFVSAFCAIVWKMISRKRARDQF